MSDSKISELGRFKFGENWAEFLKVVNDERIILARDSLKEKLGLDSLEGKSFLDIGSGSGLFSLAARSLGATVHSFDFDEDSVSCTRELKRRYFDEDSSWTVEQGSVLDESYLNELGQWDIVYSWGVLHHTGDLRKALKNVVPLVGDQGILFIAIYNQQRIMTKVWRALKKLYNRSPKAIRWVVLLIALIGLWGPRTIYDVLRGKPFYTWRNYAEHGARGMSAWRDLLDWVGGYPFEAAQPEEIFRFYKERGFSLEGLTTCGGGIGCNEFVFKRFLPLQK